jgi:hypothetical protein
VDEVNDCLAAVVDDAGEVERTMAGDELCDDILACRG